MSPSPGPSSVAALIDDHLELVLQLIREGRATTRPQLMAITGLSRKIVIQRVDLLLAMGLVREGPTVASTGGRPPGRLDFAAEAGCILAVELGATGLTAGLADLSGKVLASRQGQLPLFAPPREALQRVKSMFTRLLSEVTDRGPLRGIGVGVLGPVSPKGLTIDTIPGGGWSDFSVSEWLQPRYSVPVWVDNEVNMMALGESRRRPATEGQNLLYVKVSTGIGSGLISDGRLHRGAFGLAGELGHVTVSADRSLVCWCGNSGCLVTLASGRSIAKFGRTALRKGQSPYLEKVTARRITDAHVIAGGRAGDQACLAILNRAGEALGIAIAAATNVVNPAVVVIGGRVAGSAGPLLTDPVRRAVSEHTFGLATEQISIESSQTAREAGVSGAVLTVVEGLMTGTHLSAWHPDVGNGAGPGWASSS